MISSVKCFFQILKNDSIDFLVINIINYVQESVASNKAVTVE